MLAVMSRSDRKGFLSINGKPMDSKELAKFVGEFKDKVEELLQELEY
jgi:23S rRNA pseudoU1915 N3-methylase RlmH